MSEYFNDGNYLNGDLTFDVNFFKCHKLTSLTFDSRYFMCLQMSSHNIVKVNHFI